MKNVFVSILILMISVSAVAQSKTEKAVLDKVQQLSKAVFETKDSAAMEALVSEDLTYGHSSGVIESKAAMIRNASHNKNTYTDLNIGDTKISVNGKTAIVRYTFTATQTVDGKTSPLKLGMLQVWMKHGGKWKLEARQAVKLA